MSTTAVGDGDGVEAWCDECGSVAYFKVPDDAWWSQEHVALARARRAAELHEDNDCAPIWLDDQGEPTIINTGQYGGGCSSLLEWGEANVARANPSSAPCPVT